MLEQLTMLDIVRKYAHTFQSDSHGYGPTDFAVMRFLLSELRRYRNDKSLDIEEDAVINKRLLEAELRANDFVKAYSHLREKQTYFISRLVEDWKVYSIDFRYICDYIAWETDFCFIENICTAKDDQSVISLITRQRNKYA